MPLATLRSLSLLMTSGSRLRKSARSPNVTDPPAFGGPAAVPWPAPPPPPHAARTSSAAVSRIPSDRLPMALLSLLAAPAASVRPWWRQLTPGQDAARVGLVPWRYNAPRRPHRRAAPNSARAMRPAVRDGDARISFE